jgi:hypothetical protein
LDAGTIDELISLDPVKLVDENHPAKLYPLLVGVGRVTKIEPGFFTALEGETEPPLAFQVIVTVFAIHFA